MSPRQMQMIVTRFERLSRRISLAGLMSGHKAVEAIAAGRVRVDGVVATSNFKVFAEAGVTVDDLDAPPPAPEPKLWAMFKPRKVLCQVNEVEGTQTLRSRMRRWYEKEVNKTGDAAATGLDDESLQDKHFVIVCGLAFNADGLVMLTNDGTFAERLMRAESRVLSAYDVKVAGDPPVDMLHNWRRGARAGGVNFGPVFCSISRRNSTSTRLRLRLVESPERPVDMLLEQAKMRVQKLRRHAFGPYIVTQLPQDRVVRVPIHPSLKHFVPEADIRQALVPCPGGVLSSTGKMRSVRIEDSAISSEGLEPYFAQAASGFSDREPAQ